jgi:hypothetical protein
MMIHTTKIISDTKLVHRNVSYIACWGRHGRDRMAVEFKTTCAISAYRH